MGNFLAIIRRLFRKKHIYLMDIEDLKKYILQNNPICESCRKTIANLEDISKVNIKDNKLRFYCISCRGYK